MTAPDGYLTMARIMSAEWIKWQQKHIHSNDTGHTIIRAKTAYQDGFMKGFEARFFNNEEN